MLSITDMLKAQAYPGRYGEHFSGGRDTGSLGLIPKEYRSVWVKYSINAGEGAVPGGSAISSQVIAGPPGLPPSLQGANQVLCMPLLLFNCPVREWGSKRLVLTGFFADPCKEVTVSSIYLECNNAGA